LSDVLQFHGLEEIFSNLEVLFTVLDGLGSVVFTVSLGEHQTEDSVVSFVLFMSSFIFLNFIKNGCGLSSSRVREHDEMQFGVIVLSGNSVLGGSVEMEAVRLVVEISESIFLSVEDDITLIIKVARTLDLTKRALSFTSESSTTTGYGLALSF